MGSGSTRRNSIFINFAPQKPRQTNKAAKWPNSPDSRYCTSA